MDMSVSGGAVAAESAQATKGNGAAAKRSDSDAGGFSELLSKAGSSQNTASKDSVDLIGSEQANARNGEGSQTAPGESGASTVPLNMREGAHMKPIVARMKPIVALSNASLKQQPAAIAIDKPGKGQTKDSGDTAAEMRDIEGEGTNGDKVAEKTEAHSVKDAKPTKTLQSRTGGDKNVASDPSSLSGSDSASVSDVLGLLNSAAPDARIGTAIPLVHMNARNDTAGEKAENGTIGAASIDRSRGVDVPDPAGAQTALAAIGAITNDASTSALDQAADTDGRTTFRLSRVDGRGQSMDMHIAVDEGSPASGKARSDGESVTVLDSRRFIGLAQNSASVTAAITGDSEWARAMQPASALSNAAEWTTTGKVVNTLKIQMTPVDLGTVTATMRLSGDALNVDLKVSTGAAYRQLKEDHDHIIEALRSQGYAVDNITISMAPVEQPNAGNQPNAQGQSPQQQQSLQQGQGGEARERHTQSQGRNGGFNRGETNVEDTASGASGSSAPGSVYL